MKWFRSYGEGIKALVAISIPLCGMTAYIITSIHSVKDQILQEANIRFEKFDVRLANVEKDIGIIKTILIQRKMMPNVMMAAKPGEKYGMVSSVNDRSISIWYGMGNVCEFRQQD